VVIGGAESFTDLKLHGVERIIGSEFGDTFHLEDDDFLMATGGGGADQFYLSGPIIATGGAGQDTFTVDNNYDACVVLWGGADSDTFNFINPYGGQVLLLDDPSITDETLALLGNSGILETWYNDYGILAVIINAEQSDSISFNTTTLTGATYGTAPGGFGGLQYYDAVGADGFRHWGAFRDINFDFTSNETTILSVFDSILDYNVYLGNFHDGDFGIDMEGEGVWWTLDNSSGHTESDDYVIESDFYTATSRYFDFSSLIV